MVFAEKHADKIWVNADFDLRDQITSLPGAKYDRTNQVCALPCTWAAAKQLRAIIGDELEIGDDLYAWATNELNTRVLPCLDLRMATTFSDPGLCDGLYPFQQAGANFLIKAQRAILADDLGSGKTVQAIAAARYLNSVPALIVCPNSMTTTWKREIEKWWPGIPANVVKGTKKQRQQIILDTKGFCIMNWESIRLHSNLARYGSMALTEEERRPKELNQISWNLIIADEAHRAKDPTSKQTRALWSVGEGVEYKWCLTGTPITNTPETMYPILHFLDDKEWPSKTAFINRYCDTRPRFWGPGVDITGISEPTKEEFFEIFDPRFRRMPKEVILPQLPPIQYIQKTIDMSDEQTRSYRTMVEDMIALDENGELIIAVNPISKLTRLLQYSSACLEVTEAGPKLVGPSCKVDQLMVDLDDYLLSGESIVVFALHRQLIEMVERELKKKKIKFSVVKGNQKDSERQKAIDDFQAGAVPIILVTIQAGGTGITLTKSRIAIFLQRPWSGVDHKQAMGRVHRIGSEIHDSVLIIDYVANRTVEGYQLNVLQGKAAQLETIVRDSDTIRKILNGEEGTEEVETDDPDNS